jgi:predicted DNA-binding protein YlxM (UPF0122 family)
VRITNEVLEYVKDLDFSVREISDAFELKYQTVFYWRKKFLNLKQSEELSIVPRSKLGRPSLKSILNREELYDLYVVKKMSPREICKNYGCGYRVILKYLHYFGVPVRTRIEGLQNSKGKKKVFKRARKFQKLSEIISKEDFEKMYLYGDECLTKIGKNFNVSWAIVRDLAVFYGVPLRSGSSFSKGKKNEKLRMHAKSRRGNRNGLWKGGISSLSLLIRNSEKYKEWRYKCFKRDCFKCIKCSSGKRLEANHKKMFKDIVKEFLEKYSQFSPMEDKETLVRLSETYDEFWDTDNGETLCRSCHRKIPIS